MQIFKNGVLFISLIVATFTTQTIFAKEAPLELKKACLKNNPLAIGDTDPELIDLYTQICDKKNYKNQEMIIQSSIQIAQRYQTLGQNLKALQLVDSLRKRNITSQEMTDITFLAGIAISQNALNQMRTTELRALTETTYVPAKQLTETIRFAQPTIENYSMKKAENANKPKFFNRSTAKNSDFKKIKNTSTMKTSVQKSSKPSKTTVSKDHVIAKTTSSSSASPFDTLNKK